MGCDEVSRLKGKKDMFVLYRCGPCSVDSNVVVAPVSLQIELLNIVEKKALPKVSH